MMKIDTDDQCFKVTNKLKAGSSQLRNEIAKLSKKINFFEQFLKSSNVEVQEKHNENMFSLITNIGNLINFKV